MHPYCLRAECFLPLPDGIIHCIGTTVQEIVGGQSQRLCLAFVSLNGSKYNYAADMYYAIMLYREYTEGI